MNSTRIGAWFVLIALHLWHLAGSKQMVHNQGRLLGSWSRAVAKGRPLRRAPHLQLMLCSPYLQIFNNCYFEFVFYGYVWWDSGTRLGTCLELWLTRGSTSHHLTSRHLCTSCLSGFLVAHSPPVVPWGATRLPDGGGEDPHWGRGLGVEAGELRLVRMLPASPGGLQQQLSRPCSTFSGWFCSAKLLTHTWPRCQVHPGVALEDSGLED